METTRLCPECHAPLPADAPAGLCPRCLLQQGALRDSATAPTEPPRRHKGPPAAPPLAAVAARFPQFEVRKLIGVGGMGAVYEVRQPQLDRIVALKVMLPEVADDPKFAERFTREARALAKLNHPNIVAVYDFGQAGDWFYFVMEFVDGANLRQTMRAGRLTAAQALAIVPRLCDALQFAHDEGIMHRDIKPENILLDKKGRVKIADFGLAKLLGAEPDDPAITVTGVGMGTPRYMAPEQLDDAKNVDHRADIYSLGVVFYEMLTGELPMGRFATPSEKVRIDVRLDEIVLRSLERDVARRYQHVSEVKTAVENVTGQPQFAPTPAAPLPRSAAAPADDFLLCHPRLPRMAQAITVYCLVIVPLFWLTEVLSLKFEPDTQAHPFYWMAESLGFLVAIGGGLVVGVLKFVGGIKIRKLDLRGFTLVRTAIWLTLGLLILGMAIAVWGSRFVSEEAAKAFYFTTGEALFSALSLMAVALEITALVWLRRNHQRLADICRGHAVPAAPAAVVPPVVAANPPGQPDFRQQDAREILATVMAVLYGLSIIGVIAASIGLARVLVPALRTDMELGPVASLGRDATQFGSILVLSLMALFLLPKARRQGRDRLARINAAGLVIVGSLLTFACDRHWFGLAVPYWVGGLYALVAFVCWILLRGRDVSAALRAPKNQPPVPAISTEPRLSPHALWGAIWAGIGMFAIIPLALVFFQVHQPHQRLDEMHVSPFLAMLASILVAMTASALIGTTILGAIALAHIKRSGGRLYGRRLAIADVLFAPLLLLALGAAYVMATRSMVRVLELVVGIVLLCFAWRAMAKKFTAPAPDNNKSVAANPATAPVVAAPTTAPAPPGPPAAPPNHLNNFLGFIMTPQPGYARQVGIPMLIFTGVWLVVTLAVSFLVPQENQSVHVITMSVGLLGIPLGLLFLSLRWAVRRGQQPDPASRGGRSFLGLPAWLWPVFAALLIVAAVFVPKPRDLKEPQDMAKIFHPITLITPEGGSYRFLALDEAKKFTPVYAVTWMSVANQEVTRTFGGGTGGVNLGFFHRHARWSYQLAANRFGDWKSAADGPVELAPAERVMLRPLVVAELNRRELRRGARLEQLLGQPVEIDTFICWQNGVVLLAWLALLLAVFALGRWCWSTLVGKIALISLAGIGLLALWIFSGKAGRHGPSNSGPVENVSRAADAVPPLSTVTNGIGAQFSVPAGQVVVFELVTRSNTATVPIPNFAAYVIAPVAQALAGTFRLSREPEEIVAGLRRRPWRIEVLTPGGGRVSSAGLDLPPALDSEVGGMALGLGLAANQGTVHWQTADTNNLPATGLIGLRVRTQPHGIKAGEPGSSGASGAASIDWMSGAKVKPAATNGMLPSAAAPRTKKP